MGVVYLAHDLERDELVAVKTLSRIEPNALYRFKREFRALPYRILAGHSLAGVCAVQTLVTEPDLFQAYIASSPNGLRAHGRRAAFERALELAEPERFAGRFVFLSAGGEERPGCRNHGSGSRPARQAGRGDRAVTNGQGPVLGGRIASVLSLSPRAGP